MQKPIITTQRLELRPIEETDKSFLTRLWTDPQVRKHLGGSIGEEKAEQRAKEYINKEGYFVITNSESGEVLGLCSLDKYRTGEIEVSYELFPEAWGQGYGQETVKAVIEWGFKNMNLDHIIAVTQTANQKSRKLLESIGMVKIAEFIEFNEPQTMYSVKKYNS